MLGCRAARPHPVVHLELHTRDREGAGDFYSRLLGWPVERVEAGGGSYLALAPGGRFGGGIVECETSCPLWLPYVEVEHISEVTRRAAQLGASVVLEPREGPRGWRSIVASPEGGGIALWQPKADSGDGWIAPDRSGRRLRAR